MSVRPAKRLRAKTPPPRAVQLPVMGPPSRSSSCRCLFFSSVYIAMLLLHPQSDVSDCFPWFSMPLVALPLPPVPFVGIHCFVTVRPQSDSYRCFSPSSTSQSPCCCCTLGHFGRMAYRPTKLMYPLVFLVFHATRRLVLACCYFPRCTLFWHGPVLHPIYSAVFFRLPCRFVVDVFRPLVE